MSVDSQVRKSMSITGDLYAMSESISIHALVHRGRGRGPFVIGATNFDKVLNEFTNLEKSGSGSRNAPKKPGERT